MNDSTISPCKRKKRGEKSKEICALRQNEQQRELKIRRNMEEIGKHRGAEKGHFVGWENFGSLINAANQITELHLWESKG